jgi:hypothetical protein
MRISSPSKERTHSGAAHAPPECPVARMAIEGTFLDTRAIMPKHPTVQLFASHCALRDAMTAATLLALLNTIWVNATHLDSGLSFICTKSSGQCQQESCQ